ncbi:MAG: hypothetical protein ACPGD5_01065 [Salibacteraceae bacterium]
MKNRNRVTLQNWLLSLILVLFGVNVLFAQTWRSQDNPPNFLWSDPDSWDQGTVPPDTANIVVRGNHTIILNDTRICKKLTITGSAPTFQINASGNVNITGNLIIQSTNHDQTHTISCNGIVNYGGKGIWRNRGNANQTINVSGSGQLIGSGNLTYIADTSGNQVSLECETQITGNLTLNCKTTLGEIEFAIKDSVYLSNNLILTNDLISDPANNILDMSQGGARLHIGNNLNLNNDGGTIINNSVTSSTVYFGDIDKLPSDSKVTFHDVSATTTQNVGTTFNTSRVLGDIIIPTGVDITINNRRQIDFSSGNLVVNGSLNVSPQNRDTIRFSGSSSQTILGSGSINVSYLEFDNSTTVSNSVSAEVYRQLDVNSGTLSTGNEITLVSNADFTTNLGQVGGIITGNLKVQRFIDGLGADIGYRHFSLPIENGTIADVQYSATTHAGGLYTFGFPGSNSPSAGGYVSVFGFDEALAVAGSDFNSGWVIPSSTSDELSYENALTFYSGGTNFPTLNIEVSGVPNQGNQSISNLSFSSSDRTIGGGWHFIGNPYASSIDWSTVSKSGMDAIGYVYSETSGGYIPTNLLDDQDIVAPFQGFFIHVNSGTNSITFSESDKTTTSTGFVRSKQANNRLRMRLLNVSNGKYVPAALDINKNATLNFDSDYDAYKLNNQQDYPIMYFESFDGEKLQVNTISSKDLMNPIDLHVSSYLSDTMELLIEELPEFDGCLKLYDNVLNKFISLKIGEVYRFWVDSNDRNTDRFTILAEDNLIMAEQKDLTCFESNDGSLEIEFTQLQNNWTLIKNLADTITNSSRAQVAFLELESGFYQLNWGSGQKRLFN